jgi:hypothetical protein
MIKSIFLMLFCVLLGLIADISPSFISTSISKLGMKIMYGICLKGPSGIDDGIQNYIIKNGGRYLLPANDMLKKSSTDSREENVAQYFIELSSLATKNKP